MVRPREDPWGLPPSLRSWEAWGSLMDLSGRFQPVGPPGSSCDAYVGRVCHCHCGSDRRSRHSVRLVWVNGSFGCRTIAARTQDLIPDTILAVTTYSTIPVLPWDCSGQPDRETPPPSGNGPGYLLSCSGDIEPPPPRVCSKEGGGAVPRTRGPWPGGPEAVTPALTRSTPSVSGKSPFSDPRDPDSEP